MTAIDILLTTSLNNLSIDSKISPRDLRTLKSLAKSVSSSSYITANQGRLLLRLVKENMDILNIESADIDNPVWSKPFRSVDNTRRLYIDPDHLNLILEFTPSTQIRKKLHEIAGEIIGFNTANPKQCHALLTESNVVLLVNQLKKLDFEIDLEVESYYNTILTWKIEDILDQYRINTIAHPNFQKMLVNDLGINTPLNDNIIADRSIRYQYHVNKEIVPSTLTETIAYRNNPKIWISNVDYSIKDIMLSLIELKRLPALFVFDNYAPNEQHKILLEISEVLDELNITKVGIYFRTSNKSSNKEFNEIIANKQYNCVLDKDTTIVGVEAGKIPKFMLKNDWKPMSVVALSTQLKHSKTAVYTNCCDLIITHTEKEPLIDYKQLW